MQIRNPSEVTTKKPYGQDFVNNDIFMSREIYNHLKSVLENETAKINFSSYGEFLQDMEILHQFLIYGDISNDFPEILLAINEYLGSLGLDEEYIIEKDITNLNKFVNADYNSQI